jgi:hypothetical protein
MMLGVTAVRMVTREENTPGRETQIEAGHREKEDHRKKSDNDNAAMD